MIVDRQSGEVSFGEKSFGDGIVIRSSAIMDERKINNNSVVSAHRLQSPISWDSVTFLDQDHVGITKDNTFIDNMLFTLLESPRE